MVAASEKVSGRPWGRAADPVGRGGCALAGAWQETAPLGIICFPLVFGTEPPWRDGEEEEVEVWAGGDLRIS